MLLDTHIKFLKGVGEKRAEQFGLLGISTIDSLLHYYPRTYEDWSNPVPIFGSEIHEKCCIRATVSSAVVRRRAKSGITVFETYVFDDSGTVHIVIFNNKYAAGKLNVGQEFLFYGKVSIQNGVRQMLSPSIESADALAKIRPVYRTTKNMSSKYIEKCVEKALSVYSAGLEDEMPQWVQEKYGLMPIQKALTEIHFPSSYEKMLDARKRFIFEELFCLQLGLRMLRSGNRTETNVQIKKDFNAEFYNILPFQPTSAQKRAIDAATEDLKSGLLMNRLLQGDVGSGKTMVAAALCYTMAKNGYQSAIMVPTEILASQHFDTINKFLANTGIQVQLITGSMSAAEKRNALENLVSGEALVAVGTHALISDNVDFASLGLVITDEQHRFGVRQRGKLSEKGVGAHVLVMSATPIPRTLALAIYGDLDVSIIDELPKGRIPVETYRIDGTIRTRAYNYIKKHLDEGRQAYIVCPTVDESENTELISATQYYNRISENEFKNYSVGLLHGQMRAADKNDVMTKFLAGEIQLLVSTVVIEVGVDVPNAAIMLIENAERFGLSQLHQLRGRVGRGQFKSTCILVSDNKGDLVNKRLKAMCSTSDGFKIAQQDLALRGPGDFFGARQHGLPELKIADMLGDMDVLNMANEAAEKLIGQDPNLDSSESTLLRDKVKALFSRMESTC